MKLQMIRVEQTRDELSKQRLHSDASIRSTKCERSEVLIAGIDIESNIVRSFHRTTNEVGSH